MDPGELVNHHRRTVRRGRFSRSDGVVYIATVHADGTTPLPSDVVAGYLVHEVAHAVAGPHHSMQWREAFLALLHIATSRLGWRVTLECGACPSYGVCEAYQCPACEWGACKSGRRSRGGSLGT
jgi:hypothetical protein